MRRSDYQRICGIPGGSKKNAQRLPRGSKSVQGPGILYFIVAQNIIISVVSANAKINRGGGIPLIVHFIDDEISAAESKFLRPLIGLKSRVTLDANFVHRRRLQSARVAPISFGCRRPCLRFCFNTPAAIVPNGGKTHRTHVSTRYVSLAVDISRLTALYAAPTNSTIAVRYIKSSRPIAAARPP